MRRVQFVELREQIHSFVVPEHYKFTPRGRLQFLQRWAWRFLGWRGALKDATDTRLTYTRHVIDTDDVARRLFEQRSGLMRGYMKEPKELLIGSEDFAELMNAPEIRDYVSFGAEYSSERRIMGLTVRVIPWMQGMVVMP